MMILITILAILFILSVFVWIYGMCCAASNGDFKDDMIREDEDNQ